MNFVEIEKDPSEISGVKRAVSSVGRSAEYSIAVALLGVCVVAGGALWFLSSRDHDVQMPQPSATATSQKPAVDESATIEEYQKRLGDKFDQIDAQRQRAADAEEAQRVRQETARAAAAASAAAEAEAQQMARLDATQQAKAAAMAAIAAAGAQQKPGAAPAAVQAPVATPTPVAAQAPLAAPPITTTRAAAPVQSAPASQATKPLETAMAAPSTGVPAASAGSRTEAAIDWSSCSRPKYPERSMSALEEGTVVVSVNLDAGAKILDSKVSTSSGFGRLDMTTLNAVRKCRFNVATVGGVPQASTATVKMVWKLN